MTRQPWSRKLPHLGYALGEASNALNLLLIALIARWLGVEPYGDFIAILAAAGIFGQIAEFGFGPLVARSIARQREKGWAEVRFALERQALLGVPMLLAFYGYLTVALPSELHLAGLLIGTSVCFQALKSTLRGSCRGLERFGIEAVFLWTERLGLLAAGILVLVAGGGLYGLGWVFFTVRAVDLLLFFAVVTRLFASGRGDPGTPSLSLTAAVPLALAGLLWFAYYQVDTAMIAVLGTMRDTGIYGALYRFVDVLHVLPRLIVVVSYPAMVVAWTWERSRFHELLGSLQSVLTLAAVPALGIVLLWSEWLLRMAFGDDYASGAPALRLVVLGVYFAFYSVLLSQALVAAGAERRLVTALFGSVVLNVTANAFLIPSYGFMGAAVATLVTEIAYASVLWVMVLRLDAPRDTQPGIAEALGLSLLAALAFVAPWLPRAVWIGALVVFVSVGTTVLLPRLLRSRETGKASGRSLPDP